LTLPDYLEGAIDLHVHSSPDVDPRRFDDIELVREAARVGMGAVLLKSHQNSTVERACLVRRVVSGIDVHGGLVLNRTVGGLNIAAVELALRLGAKQIWMPTRSAANHLRACGEAGGISVLDSCGSVRPEAIQIVELAAAYGAVIGTGHLAPDEAVPLIEFAVGRGARVLVTHPEWSATRYPVDLQRRLGKLPNVFFERCFVSLTHLCGHTPLSVITSAIAEVGVASTVLSTDLGQPDTPPPAEGFRRYAEMLHAEGFDPDRIRQMMRDNPRALLSCEGTAPTPRASSREHSSTPHPDHLPPV
jgi:hypothetical protein